MKPSSIRLLAVFGLSLLLPGLATAAKAASLSRPMLPPHFAPAHPRFRAPPPLAFLRARHDHHRSRGLTFPGDGYDYPYGSAWPDVSDAQPVVSDDPDPPHGAVHVAQDPATETSYVYAVTRTTARPRIILLHAASAPRRHLPQVIYGSMPVDTRW